MKWIVRMTEGITNKEHISYCTALETSLECHKQAIRLDLSTYKDRWIMAVAIVSSYANRLASTEMCI